MKPGADKKFMIREGKPEEIEAIAELYGKARDFMRRSGNPDQWADGYPTKADIAADMSEGNCFVGLDRDGNIAMVFSFILGEDPTYQVIDDGEWPDDEAYGTIHRLGSDGETGGVLEACVDFCLSKTDNLRLDTHVDNRPMLGAVGKLGFIRCGTIYCRDGSPRIAFQKKKGRRKIKTEGCERDGGDQECRSRDQTLARPPSPVSL